MKIKKSIEYHFERINTLRKEIKEYTQLNPPPKYKSGGGQYSFIEYCKQYFEYHKQHEWYLLPRNEELRRHIQDVNNWRMKNWIDYKVEIFCM